MKRSTRLVALIGIAICISPVAHPQGGREAVPPEACAMLNDADFSGVPDAPTQLLQAKVVAAAAQVPAHCHVLGYISPNIGFEMKLPLASWNGKFLQVGCGGMCGVLLDAYVEPGHDCNAPLRKGYACITSDQGHKSTISDGKWGYNNLSAVLEYGYRAAHVATLAGKAIATRLYDRRPAKSYFWGCSSGGRQGMVEAQQFPMDFDGVVIGAPSVNLIAHRVASLWNDRSMKDARGQALISAADARNLQAAVISACDLNDGIEDGLIGDPRECRFDPADIACSERLTSACLTPPQVAAVKAVISGPANSRGESLYHVGLMPETNFDELNLLRRGGQSRQQYLSGEFLRYMGFMPAPGPHWKNSDFDFDRDPQRLGLADALLSAANPDLRRFKAAGGKMIVYQGWSDVSVSPMSIIDYYEMVERTMGGRAATQDFMRLFMIPGMEHCVGGPGAVQVDYLTALEAWVEAGQAPDVLVGAQVTGGDLGDWNFPIDPDRVAFTRPIYPYPARAFYKGQGNPRDHTSFKPVQLR